MSLIKNKGSILEKRFESGLKKSKIKYKEHVVDMPGKPDFVLKKIKTVIFIDSCFWHGCRYHCKLPKTNREFWKRKILKNKNRDKKVNKMYKQTEWNVFRVWEHVIKGKKSHERVDGIINNFIKMVK